LTIFVTLFASPLTFPIFSAAMATVTTTRWQKQRLEIRFNREVERKEQ